MMAIVKSALAAAVGDLPKRCDAPRHARIHMPNGVCADTAFSSRGLPARSFIILNVEQTLTS
jgi:hypothetical protein